MAHQFREGNLPMRRIKKHLKAAVDQQLTQLNFCKATPCDTAQILLNHITLSGKDSTRLSCTEGNAFSSFTRNPTLRNTTN